MRLPPAPGRLIDVGGHRLHLHCQGAGGPPVVFDAALGASSLSWTYVLPEVAAFARACAFDRAGFAWSDAGPLPRTTAPHRGGASRAARRRGRAPAVRPGGALVRRPHRPAVPAAVSRRTWPVSCCSIPRIPKTGRRRQPAHAALVRRGVQLCRYARHAARFAHHATSSPALAQAGALGSARLAAFIASRGALQRVDEEVMAPAAKLPPDVRAIAQRFWTQPKFFEALGSQIESIGESAAAVPGGSGVRRRAAGRRFGRDELGCGPAGAAGTACRPLDARPPRHRRAQRPLDSARSARTSSWRRVRAGDGRLDPMATG